MLDRATCLSTLAEDELDLLVVGGGITGAGVALDAAARGMSVGVIERGDWAEGTSSRSTKMIHGGLRYLQGLDLRLVREALSERRLMVRLAPHLARPLPFLVPSARPRGSRSLSVGLGLYRALGMEPIARVRSSGPPWWSPDTHRNVDGEEAVRLVPALAGRPPASAAVFTDCQTDDARLVLAVLEAAARRGAVTANRAEAVRVLTRGGRAVGAAVRDLLSGAELEVRARRIVNATGVWADRLEGAGDEVPELRPSRGSHLVLDPGDVRLTEAACAIEGPDGRRMLAIPWQGRVLCGPTDTDHDGPLAPVRPSRGDLEQILGAVNETFGLSLGLDAAVGAFAGLRPLVSDGRAHRSADVSRREAVVVSAAGVVTVTGGKLTTWRRMAERTVDTLLREERRSAPSMTGRISLGRPASGLRADGVLADEAAGSLAARLGEAAHEVIELARREPALRAPIVPGRPEVLAEVVHAARSEQATGVADVLLRRTRLGVLAATSLRTAESVEPVARALGSVHGWTEGRIAAEASAWVEVAEGEGLDPARSPAAART